MTDYNPRAILHMTSGAGWIDFERYLSTLIDNLHLELESCPIESVREIQGKISIIKDISRTREKMEKIVDNS